MTDIRSACRGALLGLAVGDAMGYTVDSRSWREIQEDYGPNGLLGYDLVNGYADVTSYTQLAAYTCNGMLLGLTQGQMQGKMSPLVRYIGLSHREWAASQRPWGRPEKTFCWLIHRKEICRRHCMDTWMLDTLSRQRLGNPEEPANLFSTPGSITAGLAVGLCCHTGAMDQRETDRLGAEAVALTHGSPAAFLPGAMLAHLLSRLIREPGAGLETRILEAADAVENQFGREYVQATELRSLVRQAVEMSHDWKIKSVEAMERLRCESGIQVLAGAVYAALVGKDDFDTAMIISVNHSGRSAAVGAITGCLLGAVLGEEALPEFYLECLEPAQLLQELADDVFQGCPMERNDVFYDDDWDRKYLQGGNR